MNLFNTISELLGVPQQAVEGGVVTLLSLAVVYLLQLLRSGNKHLTVQQITAQQLVQMSANVIKQNSDTLVAIKTAIETMALTIAADSAKMAESLQQHNTVAQQEFVALSRMVQDVQQNLFRKNRTQVLVREKDSGTIFAEFSATPEQNPDGTYYLVVEYEVKKHEETAE